MPLKTVVATLFLALFAAGCAPQAPAVPTQAALPTDASAPTVEVLGSAGEFVATPGGEVNLAEEASPFVYAVSEFEDTTTFPAPGFYNCINGMEVLSSGTAGDNEIMFTLPPEIVAGEYVLQETTIAARLVYNGVTFETGVLGLLSLEEAPNAQGEPVIGSFDFFVNDGAGRTINTSGTFAMLANGVCP